MSIIIFSRPVRSGKTSELQYWCSTQKNTSGILMPDVNGKRMLLDIRSGILSEIECDDPVNSKFALQAVGKYFFYASAFEKANSILLKESATGNGTGYCMVIIDEVGKLELQSMGLYEATKNLLENRDYKTSQKNLLLVVRDSLYQQVVSFFKITDHILIRHLTEIPPVDG